MSNPSHDQPPSTSGATPIVPGPYPTSGPSPTIAGPSPVPGQPPAPRKRLGPGAIIAIVAGVLVLACCGVGLVSLLVNQQSDENTQAPQTSTSATAPDEGGATTPADPTTPTDPTTPPRAVPEDQAFEGFGADVITIDLDPDFAHIATITHTGSSNFVVWTIGADGSQLDLLVNEIGNYSGVRPVDFRDNPAALQIEADGGWRIVIQALNKAPRWPAQSAGTGSAVLVVDPGAVSGLTTVTITHSGESNFVVWAYGERNTDLLVNEIGSYSGRTILPSWALVLEIEADGAWTITAT